MLTLLLFPFLRVVSSQRWNPAFQAPLDFQHSLSNSNFNALNGQQWHNSMSRRDVEGRNYGGNMNMQPAQMSNERPQWMQNIDAHGITRPIPPFIDNAVPPTTYAPVGDELKKREEAMRAMCPPPSIRYIVVRTINGEEQVDEAEETRVTEEELLSLRKRMGLKPKREVIPATVTAEQSPSTTQTTPVVDSTTQSDQDVLELNEDADGKCNNEILRTLILVNIVGEDAAASKRAIHETANAQLRPVDVICSTSGFTYLVSTTFHCEAQRDGVICFVYTNDL